MADGVNLTRRYLPRFFESKSNQSFLLRCIKKPERSCFPRFGPLPEERKEDRLLSFGAFAIKVDGISTIIESCIPGTRPSTARFEWRAQLIFGKIVV